MNVSQIGTLKKKKKATYPGNISSEGLCKWQHIIETQSTVQQDLMRIKGCEIKKDCFCTSFLRMLADCISSQRWDLQSLTTRLVKGTEKMPFEFGTA